MDIQSHRIRCYYSKKSQKQKGFKFPITFNNTGSLILQSDGNDIKILSFSSNHKQLRSLKGHMNQVSCIVFSKKFDWFVSGDWKGDIICWNGLKSIRAQQQHYYVITHLLLNKNEDELISCSSGSSIKVWKVKQLKITYEYEFEFQQTQFICGIALNESENYIVMCGYGKITLWKKHKKWKYKSKIQNLDRQKGVYFISDSLFIWQHQVDDVSEAGYQQQIIDWQTTYNIFFEILEIKNDQLLRRTDFKVHFNVMYKSPVNSFQFTYNPKMKMILQSHGRYLYILKQVDFEFKVVNESIDLNNNLTFGTFTQDSEYFVAWYPEQNNYSIYKIK